MSILAIMKMSVLLLKVSYAIIHTCLNLSIHLSIYSGETVCSVYLRAEFNRRGCLYNYNIFFQEFSKRTEGIAVQAENLVKEASEIPLGPKNKQLLQQQAKSIKEQVKKLEDTLEEEYVLDKSQTFFSEIVS